ncbi:MAG TPA: ABC transporter ATP-binding protein [Acidiferrobacteraceae bacterium]|nr:ABC transporter ATP-binding protein [Acidiferrobacteraceae bacterium]
MLDVTALSVSFGTEQGRVNVVRDVGFQIRAGETVALVGESGCGKSVTALAIMGLIDYPGRVDSGSIRLLGDEIINMPTAQLQAIRGRRVGMIFQEPMTSLNPVFTIGNQIGEVLINHFGGSEAAVREQVLELLAKVGISSPQQRINQYPHELSGGMKQRVMIAMALACKPDLLIADEPTTALDVTIQAQILALLKELQDEMGMAVLLITHNLGVVAHFASQVMVMYAGEIVERAAVRPLFKSPSHPYTRALLESIPTPAQHGRPLACIVGTVPSPFEFPSGCRFSTRCSRVMARCHSEHPNLVTVADGQQAACWLNEEGAIL